MMEQARDTFKYFSSRKIQIAHFQILLKSVFQAYTMSVQRRIQQNGHH